MLEEVAVEERLALFAEPEHRVQLGARPRRRHLPQELHVPGRHLHVDHEVRTREREEVVDLPRVEDDCVELEPAGAVVEHRHDERQLLVAVEDLAEHVRGLAPVERRAEHLDLVVALEVRPGAVQALVNRVQQVIEVACQVGEGPLPGEVEDHALEALVEARVVRVVAAVDRRVGPDVLGRHRGPHEDQVVVGIGAVQDPRDHRVEERLGELGLRMVDEQADVEELCVLPDTDPERLDVELRAQAGDTLADALVVEADPLLDGLLRLGPGGGLEVGLRAGARRAEEPVMLVEALDQDRGDLPGRIVAGKRRNRADVRRACDSLAWLPGRHFLSHEDTVGDDHR